MNRRNFLAASVAALLTPSLLIAPARRRINLATFCGAEGYHGKYDLTRPFQQGEHTYATDGRICVDVAPLCGDIVEATVKLPPADRLPYWDHDRRQGWRTLPKGEILDANNYCLECDGEGYLCSNEVYTIQCRGCYCKCWVKRPSIVRIEYGNIIHHFDLAEWEKVNSIGDVEYHPINDGFPSAGSMNTCPIRFRFAEGVGLIMPLVNKVAEERLR